MQYSTNFDDITGARQRFSSMTIRFTCVSRSGPSRISTSMKAFVRKGPGTAGAFLCVEKRSSTKQPFEIWSELGKTYTTFGVSGLINPFFDTAGFAPVKVNEVDGFGSSQSRFRVGPPSTSPLLGLLKICFPSPEHEAEKKIISIKK